VSVAATVIPDCGVVIVAAGLGLRMGGTEPKQLRPLDGLPLFLWSARFFDVCAAVREIVIVAPPALTGWMTTLCVRHSISRLRGVVAGGARRQDSVATGVAALSPGCVLAAVHDAARPFPPRNFEEGLAAARRHGGAVFGHPVSDTIKAAQEGRVMRTIARTGLWCVQTPQIFRREVLADALVHCRREGIEVTDDAAAVEAVSGTVCMVPGSRWNMKVTVAEDWIAAQALARVFGVPSSRPVEEQP
jgi:2-C-methyl-D-erythritol 4-phosphate cytidylyltransferase